MVIPSPHPALSEHPSLKHLVAPASALFDSDMGNFPVPSALLPSPNLSVCLSVSLSLPHWPGNCRLPSGLCSDHLSSPLQPQLLLQRSPVYGHTTLNVPNLVVKGGFFTSQLRPSEPALWPDFSQFPSQNNWGPWSPFRQFWAGGLLLCHTTHLSSPQKCAAPRPPCVGSQD